MIRLAAELPPLGVRHLEVLDVLAQGASIPEMAAKLHISAATVKREVSSLFHLMGVTSRVELVLEARRLGIVADRKTVVAR